MSMNKQVDELKNIIEAAILVADDPITVSRLMSLFSKETRPEKQAVAEALQSLIDDCEHRGVLLVKVGNGYRYQSKERYAEFLRKLYEQKPPRYSRAVLETLSIIAYKQPVTRGDIEEVRGVSVSTDIMRTLLNRGWVKEVGFKAVPGRPALYATTKEFLAYFNLKSIREMPTLQDRRGLDEIAKDNQIALPLENTENNADETDDETQQVDKQVDTVNSDSPDVSENAEATAKSNEETAVESSENEKAIA